MRVWTLLICGSLLASCAYVTKGEFLEEWDEDGDGWPIGQDCNDEDPRIYPYAPDLRGDGCNADCGMEADADGDDWPDDADCSPDDPNIYPCSGLDVAADTIDSDCDGSTNPRNANDDPCPTADPDHADAPDLTGCVTVEITL